MLLYRGYQTWSFNYRIHLVEVSDTLGVVYYITLSHPRPHPHGPTAATPLSRITIIMKLHKYVIK